MCESVDWTKTFNSVGNTVTSQGQKAMMLEAGDVVELADHVDGIAAHRVIVGSTQKVSSD